MAHAAPINNTTPEAPVKVQTASPKKTDRKVVKKPVKKVVTERTPQVVRPRVTITTNKQELMRLAGIPQSEWAAVDYIISHESGWRPDATNPSSGAHGLPQALPYSKTGCGWVDAVCQLKWADGYATQRYGGWWPAYNFWLKNHWW